MIGSRDVWCKRLYERRHGADLPRVLDALVHIGECELGRRRHPPGQICGHFLFPFEDRLTSPALLIVKVAAELEVLQERTRASDKEIDPVGAHVVSQGKSVLTHAVGIKTVVVPNPGHARLASGKIGICILNSQIGRVAGEHLWNVYSGEKRTAAWNGKFAPFIFRAELSIDL